jgi:hypothetical protein
MSRTTREKVLALSTLAAVVALYCLVRRGSAPPPATSPEADPGLVDGRLWVDSQPEKLTDYVQGAFFVSSANLGLFERSSSFDVHFELFDMTRETKTIRLTFPQTKRSANFRYSVRECREKKPFDLCLDISSNPWGGPTRYYGFSRPDDEDRAFGRVSARMHAAVARATGEDANAK